MKIRVKFLSDVYSGKLQKIDGAKSDWIDLRAAHDIFIPVGTSKMVSLGVCIELPKGYEAHIVPRSSTFSKWGIIQTNHMGVIDNAYCGDYDEWMMNCYCLESRTVYNGESGTRIKKGDRICQFRIEKVQPEIEFESVKWLGNDNRNGFGSTGEN